MNEELSDDEENVCLKFRQTYLRGKFMEMYSKKKKSCFILDKLINRLKKNDIHTLLLINEFKSKHIPTVEILKQSGSYSLKPNKIDLLVALDPLNFHKEETLFKSIEKCGEMLYCHLPTKYRISHAIERFTVKAIREKSCFNASLYSHMENRHHLLPIGEKPFWVSISEINEHMALKINEFINTKTNCVNQITVISKYKLLIYKIICKKLNWKYIENECDITGMDIPNLVIFGIPTVVDWQTFISRARNFLLIITERKIDR